MASVRPDEFILVLLCVTGFSVEIFGYNRYYPHNQNGISYFPNDPRSNYNAETDENCDWVYTRNYNIESVETMSFDEFRNSQDAAVKIKDNFGTTILSPMFIDRNKFERDTSQGRLDGTWIQYLDLSSNKFEKIMPQTFKTVYRCLQYLILKNNNISDISDLVFYDLKHLRYLDLSKNKLNFVKPVEWFQNLRLDYLNLSYNMIHEVKDRGHNFWHSQRAEFFQTFDLSHNKIKAYNNFEFRNNLRFYTKYLNLSYNMLNRIEIKDNSSLYELNLAHNQFEIFNCINLENVDSLITLNLSSNKITDFKCFNLKNLTLIDLTRNNIRTLSENAFKNLQNLTYLYLSHNKILLKSNMFKTAPALNYLSLGANNFLSIPVRTFNGLSNLVTLELNGNKLKYFEFGSFAGLYHLTKLDLSDNKIEFLDINKLMDLDDLHVLLLDGNYLNDLNLTDLNFKLSKLSIVSLSNMPWSCENLANIKIELRKLNVNLKMVPYGNDFNSSINGIKCFTKSNNYTNKPLVELNDIVTEKLLDKAFDESITFETLIEEHTDINNLISTERLDSEDSVDTTEVALVDKNIDKNQTLSLPMSGFFEKMENIIKSETNEIKENLIEIKNFTLFIINKIEHLKENSD